MNDSKAQAAHHPDQPPSPGGAGMTRTTADWEKLLKGTTPAPWEALREDDTPVWTIGRLGDNPARIVGDVYGEDNARLIASAPDLAHTIIAQAAQIKRLQEAVTALMADLNESDFGLYSEYETRSTPPFQPRTLDEYLTAEDMEDTDD